ncbi:MAG: hypothetical protein KTR32_08305 [Granulosicoccus sp.]|nr:hypothetical protein [Granulosicoccus sp.]
MDNQLQKVTRTLHELIKTLPAVRAKCSAEVINRHLQLIAHFQKRYDLLVLQQAAS